jgi:hypothetical protein
VLTRVGLVPFFKSLHFSFTLSVVWLLFRFNSFGFSTPTVLFSGHIDVSRFFLSIVVIRQRALLSL